MTDFLGIICPKCLSPLKVEGNTLKCSNGHCYDISSQGYVNLLPPHKGGSVPGDNKEMVRARRTFLNNGYYKPLADELARITAELCPSFVADIGCGEGYYTSRIKQEAKATVKGFDISKFALAYAAKAYKDIDFCVANLHSLPMADNTVDVITCCFCAHDENEFARVLKDGGFFILVTPGAKHLFSLKSVVYDDPYENPADEVQIPNFELTDTKELCFDFTVNGDDIWNLFSMTPYFWKSPKEGAQRLRQLASLTTTADFVIRIYRKK